MKACLQYWVRASLLAVMVALGMAPFGVRAESVTSAQAIADITLSAGAEDCCGAEAAMAHPAKCLSICDAGQAVLSGAIECLLPPVSNVWPAPDIGADTRFADLEPHPPKDFSGTI
jgi:hypothetical protein